MHASTQGSHARWWRDRRAIQDPFQARSHVLPASRRAAADEAEEEGEEDEEEKKKGRRRERHVETRASELQHLSLSNRLRNAEVDGSRGSSRSSAVGHHGDLEWSAVPVSGTQGFLP